MKINKMFTPQILFAPDGTDDSDVDFMDEEEDASFQDNFRKPLDDNNDDAPKDEDDLVDEADLEDDDDIDPSDDDDDDDDDEDDDADEEDEDEDDDEDEEEEEKPDLATRQAQLLKVIDELSGGLDLNDVQAGEVIEQSFVTDDEFDALQEASSAKEMNDIFNKVYKKMIAVSDRRANIIAGNKLTHQVQTAETTDTFYRENPELAEVKELVLSKAKTIFAKSEDKDLTLADLLDKAGTAVREALGLKKGSKNKEDKKSPTANKKKRNRKAPRVPGTNGGGRKKKRAPKKKPEGGLEAELDMFAQHNKKVRSL